MFGLFTFLTLMPATGYFTHPDCRKHEMGPGHPECPERLDAIEDRLLITGLADALDNELIARSAAALDEGHRVEITLPISNVNRSVGTMLGSRLTRKWGGAGLADGTITLRFSGSAGQSFGAFVPRGIDMFLEGDANDYLGKGFNIANL